MSLLRIYLFGTVKIAHHCDSVPEIKITRSVQALLAYLLLHRHRIHPREVLAGLFWGDHSEDRARSCLSTALWRLRRVLEPEGTPKGTYLFTASTGEVGFNKESSHWLDVAEFEETLSPCLRQLAQQTEAQDPCKLQTALELYTGDLLEGFYDDWALRERERLRALYLKSLAHLMMFYKHEKSYEKSLACGQRILNLDPLREGIHREMMRLYAANGQRTQAIRQYKTCCRILDEELGVPPLEETQALFGDILQGTADQLQHALLDKGQARGGSDETTSVRQVFQKLNLAMRHFDKTGEQLQRAIRLLERLVDGNHPRG